MKSIEETRLHIDESRKKLDQYSQLCEEVYKLYPEAHVKTFDRFIHSDELLIDPILSKESLKNFSLSISEHDGDGWLLEKYPANKFIKITPTMFGRTLADERFLLYIDAKNLKEAFRYYPKRLSFQFTKWIKYFKNIVVTYEENPSDDKELSFEEFMDYYPVYFNSLLFK